MSKTIALGTDKTAADRFQILYQGFVLGAPEGGVKGIEAARRAFRIMDKLEAISEQATGSETDGGPEEPLFYQTGDAIRTLKPDATEIVFDDAEIVLIRAHLNTVPWRVSLTKLVVEVDDLLAA